MQTASESLRAVAAPRWRLELKFFFPYEAAALLALRNCGLPFARAYPARTVTTLYLDTPSLDAYRAVVEGLFHRKKTRIRWYPGTPWPVAAELKLRRGMLVGKQATELGPAPEAHAARQQVALRLVSLARSRLPALFAGLVPVAATSYRRSYFATPDGSARATVDTCLSFRRLVPLPLAAPTARILPPGGCVLELKFPRQHVELAAKANLPRIPESLSKYRLAVECSRTAR